MVEVIKQTFMEVLPDVWPMLIIITVIISSLRITYLITKHKKFLLHKEIIYLLAVIYLLCLFHVVTFQDINYGTSNFIPFKEIFRYDIGSHKFFRNVMGNIMLFIPFGFLSSYLLKNRKLGVVTILTIIASLTIEVVQYYIGRVFDIDDIILNLVGGIVGFLIYVGLDAIKNKIKLFKNDTILDILIIMFEIFNETDKEIIEIDKLQKYMEFVVKKLEIETAIFNIIFVSNEEIHRINKEYRKVDRVTDVISFALEDNPDIVYEDFRLLGDIYIAVDIAYDQAIEYNHSREREVCFLATHGLLHLLGYDHMTEEEEKEMFGKQEELLKEYGINR